MSRSYKGVNFKKNTPLNSNESEEKLGTTNLVELKPIQKNVQKSVNNEQSSSANLTMREEESLG